MGQMALHLQILRIAIGAQSLAALGDVLGQEGLLTSDAPPLDGDRTLFNRSFQK